MAKTPRRKRSATPSTEQRVVNILRALNPTTPDSVLATMAQSLHIAARLGLIADLPRARDIGSKTTRRELDTLANLAGCLITHIHGMHSDALRAFERVTPRNGVLPPLHPILMATELLKLADAAILAQEGLSETPPHKGNRPMRQAQEVTRQACTIYSQLTRKAVRRATDAHGYGHPSYGPSKTFLTALFKALHMTASADSQLKLFIASSRLAESLPRK